jgi:high-affinity iron transporter
VSSLVTGVLGIQPFPTWIMVTGWLVYLVPMVAIVAWPARRRPPKPVTATVSPAGAQPTVQ